MFDITVYIDAVVVIDIFIIRLIVLPYKYTKIRRMRIHGYKNKERILTLYLTTIRCIYCLGCYKTNINETAQADVHRHNTSAGDSDGSSRQERRVLFGFP